MSWVKRGPSESIGWSEQISRGHCRFRFGFVLNIGRMMPTSILHGGGLSTEIMVAVPLALTLKPHNSTFPCMSLTPPELLSFHQSPGKCLRATESLRRPFKGTSGFPAAFHYIWMVGIPTDFHGQILWGILLVTGTLGWGTPVWG